MADWKTETELAMRRVYDRLKTPNHYLELVTPYEEAVYCELEPTVAAVFILTGRAAAISARRAHDLSIAAFNA